MRPERKAPVAAPDQRQRAAAWPARRTPAAPALSPANALRQRLGNQGTQALVARSASAGPAHQVQRMTTVGAPNDPAELEARATASTVMRMEAPVPADVAGTAPASVQRAPPSAAAAPAEVRIDTSGGAPLPSAVRGFMEPRFGADFSGVRVHTGEAAAAQSAQLNARAFAVGSHVFFGRGQYQPATAEGRELIAHELTHTIQQGAAPQRQVVRRDALPLVAARSGARVQRDWFDIKSPREYFADKARAIPGFTMLTVVIGLNPITNTRVERSAGNILRGAIEMIPGGSLITDALNAHGVFGKVSAWASAQFDTLKDIGSNLWQEIENFFAQFKLRDLADPGALIDRASAIVERPIARIKAFAIALKDGIVTLIKEAILKPVAAFARTSSGYPLLCTVMGRDPITGEAVPQSAELLLGAFMKFIGEEELWNTMQKAQAVPRAYAWFTGALEALRGFVGEIPDLFVQAFKSLEVMDIILIPRAFTKLAHVFGGFAKRFVSWGAQTVWKLLEIIFDVVSPGALGYIKKTGSAIKSIFKNPLPFVGNLVRAAKLGFLNFADRFLTHLQAGLIDWLTGSLPGIYIPKAFTLGEIAKFAFSVLGLSWANIRLKLVKAAGEPVVKAMETGFDIVVTLVRDGPAAAWDKIKEQLSNLKDMVIGGITDFVVDMVVKKAVPKLIAMFIPGAGFIAAIVSIYDTVMVFVNKISKIIEVVTGFIDSIVAIAGGAIDSAAKRVESTLAGLLSLAINFLAGFAGLGKVADKVMAVIEKIRAPIDKALDWLVNWIVTAAKKLFSKVFGKKEKPDVRTDAEKQSDLRKAIADADGLMAKKDANPASVQKGLGAIKTKYNLASIELVRDSATETSETDHVKAKINPEFDSKPHSFVTAPPSQSYEVVWAKNVKGQTVGVRATLKEVAANAVRSSQELSAQSKAAAAGKSTDAGGHLIGHRFVKNQGIINMFPQNASFNNSAWKTMENEWAAAINAGNHVNVDITLVGGTVTRPEIIEVIYELVDVTTKKVKHFNAQSFKNDEFQKFERLSTKKIKALT